MASQTVVVKFTARSLENEVVGELNYSPAILATHRNELLDKFFFAMSASIELISRPLVGEASVSFDLDTKLLDDDATS